MTRVTKALILTLPIVLAACGSDRSSQTASTTTVSRPMASSSTVSSTDQTMYQRSLRK